MLSGTSSTISITVKSLLFSSLHFYVVSYPRRSSLNKNAPVNITTIVLVSVTGCIFYILDLSIACISYSNIHDSISLLFLRRFSPPHRSVVHCLLPFYLPIFGSICVHSRHEISPFSVRTKSRGRVASICLLPFPLLSSLISAYVI